MGTRGAESLKHAVHGTSKSEPTDITIPEPMALCYLQFRLPKHRAE